MYYRKITLIFTGLLLALIATAQVERANPTDRSTAGDSSVVDFESIKNSLIYQDYWKTKGTTVSPIAAEGSLNLLNRLSFTTESGNSKISANINVDLSTNSALTFKVTSPVSSGNTEVQPITASGLSNGSTFEVGWSKTDWDADLNSLKLYDFLREVEHVLGLPSDTLLTLTDVEDVMAQRNLSLNYDSEMFIDFGVETRYGLSFSLTKQSFGFINDLNDLTEQSQNQMNVNFNAFFGIITRERAYHKFSLRAENYFKSQQKAQYQVPTGTPGITQTRELIIGAPTEVNDIRFRYEFQKFLGEKAELGINPNLNLLFESEQVFLELPLYFFRTKKEDKLLGLNGGFFASWQSDFDDIAFRSQNFNFGVFVGTDFDFGN